MIDLEINGALAIATLADAPVNAINEEWLDRLGEVVAEVEADPSASILLIRSAMKVFCAGADLKLMRERFATAEGRVAFNQFTRRIQETYERLEKSSVISIAEVAGAALGGGMELALACDLRIVANEAKVGLPEVRLGLLPGAGGTQRLTRVCGPAMAKKMILGAEVIGGEEAVARGVAHWSAPRAEISAFAEATANRLAALPGLALSESKRCIEAAIYENRIGFEIELEGSRNLLETEETQKLVSAFLEGSAG
jgi:enoyl-CoA hydratase/carnithine racemase